MKLLEIFSLKKSSYEMPPHFQDEHGNMLKKEDIENIMNCFDNKILYKGCYMTSYDLTYDRDKAGNMYYMLSYTKVESRRIKQ